MIHKTLIGLLFFLALQCQAQKKFTGGLVVGPVFSQISGDGLGGWDKLGFALGGWVGIPLSEKNSVTMSMKYITKGSRTKRDTLNFNSFGYFLNYIDIPIVFRHQFEIKKSPFSWSVGPYVGVLLNQKVKENGVIFTITESATGADFEPLDIGVQAALGWWTTPKLYFELSTSTSLLPTRPAPLVVNKGSYYERGNYNQTLQLMIGLRFGGNE